MTRTVADLPEGQRAQVGVAVHEAGHAIVAAVHHATISRVAVLRGGARTNPHGAAGVCRYGSNDLDVVTDVYMPAIVAAGSVAQAVWHHGPRPTSRQLDAWFAVNTSDHGQLRTLAFAQGEVPQPRDVLPTVLHLWPSIAALASTLYRTGHARHSDVLASLGVASTVDAPSVLNAIRNGHRPIPIASKHPTPA